MPARSRHEVNSVVTIHVPGERANRRHPYWSTGTWSLHLMVLIGLGTCISDSAVGEVKREFTVRDAIEFVRPLVPSTADAAIHRSTLSPDGRYFYYVTVRGVLETNENEYTLRIIELRDTDRRVTATELTTLRLRSSTNDPAISQIEWAGAERLYFLGASGHSKPQVYSLDPRTGATEVLSDIPDGVARFATNERGDLLYLPVPEPDPEALHEARSSGMTIGDEHYRWWIVGEGWPRVLPAKPLKLQYRAHDDHRTISLSEPSVMADFVIVGNPTVTNIWLSPDGSTAIVATPSFEDLDLWDGYTNPILREYLEQMHRKRARKSPAVIYPASSRYFLLDLKTRRATPLLTSPGSVTRYQMPSVVWSPDRRSVLINNILLPLHSDTAYSLRDAREHPAVAEVDLESRSVAALLFLEDRSTAATVLEWDGKTDTVTLSMRSRTAPVERRVFRKLGGQWRDSKKVSPGPTDAGSVIEQRIEIKLLQDINTPPKIVAIDHKTEAEVYRAELNPQFREIAFGNVEVIHWTDEDGNEWTGGLVFPPGYEPGKRYPLVIQTHGFNPAEFLVDGVSVGSSAFTGQTARALAAHDFMVLQEYAPNSHASAKYDTDQEGTTFVKSYRAVIRILTERDLIDPNAVGLHGYSRTCYHVKYVLTHADYPIAAASVADGIDFGYVQYIVDGGTSSTGKLSTKVYGAPPVGKGMQRWLDEAPTFNAIKVGTPLRIESIRSGGFMAEIEMYSALQILGIPTEMTFYPDGRHWLTKPRERQRSQQGNVDWFRFWINNEEDPAPEKAEQYSRWRAMRDRWNTAKEQGGMECESVPAQAAGLNQCADNMTPQ